MSFPHKVQGVLGDKRSRVTKRMRKVTKSWDKEEEKPLRVIT